MRVAHVMFEPARSGISGYVRDVVAATPGLAHAVALPRHLAGARPALEAAGARVAPVALRGRLDLRAVGPLAAWLRAEAPEAVHVHALEAGLVGLLAARAAGLRAVVFTPQTDAGARPALAAAWWRALRATAPPGLVLTAVNAGQAARLGARLPAASVRPVPNWVEAPPDEAPEVRTARRAEARARLGWPPEAFVAACVARLAAQKDPLTFVRAAARAPGVACVLVGDGPLRAEVARAARAAPNLRLQGATDGIDDVLAGADALCLTSRWEGMSLTLLAAMARGLPVVVTRIDGNTDLVTQGETGLLFEPGDADALGLHLGALAARPSLAASIGAAARRRVLAGLGPGDARGRLERAYAAAAGA